jgi:phosphoglycolate phosphatase
MAKHILFDLDGTLTDSGEGIINSARLVFEHYHVPVPDLPTLKAFVGPPLILSLKNHGIPEDKLEEAIEVYRGRYRVVGMYENFPYPGIEDLLKSLKALGHKLYVATSKPEYLAVGILEHFGLAQYFDQIRGADANDGNSRKADVIASVLNSLGKGQEAIMVGDTIFDVEGAKEMNLPVIGVSWGYGKVSEMAAAGAPIANTMDELLEMLNQ